MPAMQDFSVYVEYLYPDNVYLCLSVAFPESDTLSAVLWNAFHYYSQFSEEVSTWVQHRRGPLEKELRVYTICVVCGPSPE